MTTTQQIITVTMAVATTMLTRFTPFIMLRPGRPTPKYIVYLGKVLPAAMFALLVAVAATVAMHVWRRNMMWSIAVGTACYMLLIRM